MADFFDLLPRIQPHAPDAPIPHILNTISYAAWDYCTRSDAYRYSPGLIPAIANVPFYDLPLPVGTQILRVVTAKFGDTLLRPTSSVLRNAMGRMGRPQFYQQVGPRIRLVDPAEVTAPNMLFFELSLRPLSGVTSMADEFMAEHGEALILGALYYLLVQPGSPWTNPATAGFYGTQFEDAIIRARRHANNDDTAKAPATAYGGIL